MEPLLIGLAVLVGAIVLACGLSALSNHRFNKLWVEEMRQDHIRRYGCTYDEWEERNEEFKVTLSGDEEQQQKQFKDAWEKAHAAGLTKVVLLPEGVVTFDKWPKEMQ